MTEISAAIRGELDRIKRESFVESYQATDAEAMGLLLARFFEWDGLAILRSAQYGLEDANFHTESGVVEALADYVDSDGNHPDRLAAVLTAEAGNLRDPAGQPQPEGPDQDATPAPGSGDPDYDEAAQQERERAQAAQPERSCWLHNNTCSPGGCPGYGAPLPPRPLS